ncbi:50S ribosomal protein L30 [Saccharopolyspora sp. HNM0983]|uniref:Large ribosomal subunit protein uL30 n=1 Tax=Saccharopolyspora montiporae TaxID=2781240 RepID=A0A929G1S7_9PSEU|nr:50S ribosomal protein L30 [Saccharopolyspora sp. HNM0983]MBE9374993.1 50S ribosomal protein L30 [Saccharopolyspora sp. HNM0983]
MAELKITQVRGLVGTRQAQRDTMRSLGLRKIRQSVVRPDDAHVRGQINAVRHLVTVEEV